MISECVPLRITPRADILGRCVWSLRGARSWYRKFANCRQFLTPLWQGPDPVGATFTDSDPADVVLRPDILHNPNLPKDQRTVDNWFDTTAFAGPQPGRFGTSAKGVVIGPGINVWHMGLHKDFIFNERGTRLRWEMTATNIFNHPNWGNPDMYVSDGPGVFRCHNRRLRGDERFNGRCGRLSRVSDGSAAAMVAA